MKTLPMSHQEREIKEHGLDKVRAIFWEQGCSSGDTEYLSPSGWRRIDSYDGGEVAQWDQETGEATFVMPMGYLVSPCDEMYRIKTTKGVDQKITFEHKMPLLDYKGRSSAKSSRAVLARLQEHADSDKQRIPCKFTMNLTGPGLPFSEEELRLMVAVMADGTFTSHVLTTHCRIYLTKERKKNRLEGILAEAKIEYTKHNIPKRPKDSVYYLYAPAKLKHFPQHWWADITSKQRDIILSEIFHWDGTKGNTYMSKCKADVDFIQFLIATAGGVARVNQTTRGLWYLEQRRCHTNWYTIQKQHFSVEPTEDGKKYCFEVPSGYLILRRNNCIFPTGNTGKTWLALAEAELLYKKGLINAMFILAPNGLHTNWVLYEIPDHLEIEHKAIAYRTKRSNTKKHQKECDAVLNYTGGMPILAMSYDGIKTTKGKALAKKFLQKHKCFYVADESNRIKTPKAKTTMTTIQSGTYAEYKRILCGTPITNTPFDVYSQFRFLDKSFWKNTPYGLQQFGDFKTFFGIWQKMVNHKHIDPRTNKPREFDHLVAYKNLHILCELVKSISSRCLKKDVLTDLPDKLYTYRGFDLTPEQARHYIAIEEEFMTEINGEFIFTPLAITRLLRLQQVICGYLPTGDEGECILIGGKNPRLDLCLEICQDLPHKAIIWARFIKDIDLICEALGDKAVRWDGTVSDDEREDNKYRFKKCPVDEVQFMVATPDSMGEGHTLNEALTTIYYSNSYKLKERLQSEDRNHRKGQKNAVNYIDLVANNTQDLIILEALRTKFDNASKVVDGKLRDWLLTYEQQSDIL